MLAADPNERWTVDKIKNCKWYKGKMLSQEAAVKALLERKSKVEKEKLSKDKMPDNAGTNRAGGDPTIRAPPMGKYQPNNLFYCAPGWDADDIRACVKNMLVQGVMAKTLHEYIDTGDEEVPVKPEDWEGGDWKPWYDLAFTCELAEPSGDPEIPDQKFQFSGGAYIREVPSETAEGGRRHVVYFKRHRGLAHKWIKVMFKIQNRLGWLNNPQALPSTSPMKTSETPDEQVIPQEVSA